MTKQPVERRNSEGDGEEALSPEFLAVLEVCGGEIRASDRPALEGRRKTLPSTDRRLVDRRSVATRRAVGAAGAQDVNRP